MKIKKCLPWIILVLLVLPVAANAEACECDSCEDCTKKLNDNLCGEVKLTTNILNPAGTCINNPENFTGKIFDCQGNRIDGNWVEYGIYLSNKHNVTIKNCNVGIRSRTLHE